MTLLSRAWKLEKKVFNPWRYPTGALENGDQSYQIKNNIKVSSLRPVECCTWPTVQHIFLCFTQGPHIPSLQRWNSLYSCVRFSQTDPGFYSYILVTCTNDVLQTKKVPQQHFPFPFYFWVSIGKGVNQPTITLPFKKTKHTIIYKTLLIDSSIQSQPLQKSLRNASRASRAFGDQIQLMGKAGATPRLALKSWE